MNERWLGSERPECTGLPLAESESVGVILELAAYDDDYERALDIAAGDGATARAIAAIARRVVAISTAAAPLPIPGGPHSRGAAIAVGLASPFCLPFADRSFDLVTCRVAAQHFHRVRPALDEVVRVMAPGGVFVLADATHDRDEWIGGVEQSELSEQSSPPRYSPAAWCRLLEEHGLLVDTTVTTSTSPAIAGRPGLRTASATFGSNGPSIRPRVEQESGVGRDESLRRSRWHGVVVRARKP